MGVPLLGRYREQPFVESTRFDYIDFFTGDGVTDTFTVTRKNGTEVGGSAQVENITSARSTGAITIDGDDVIFTTIPLAGYEIIIPGVQAMILTASDQDDALGRVFETYAFIADVESIEEFTYDAPPAMAGIKLEFVKKVTNDDADISWLQLAPANADGTVGTYEAAGDPLYTAPIKSEDEIVGGPYAALSTAFDVTDGTLFNEGDYIIVNRTGLTENLVKILSIAGNTITHSGFEDAHSAGESVMTCGRKFWIKMTVPLDAVGGNIRVMQGIVLKTTALITTRS